MRRMITKSGIIDAVNEGIESGEIEVGGGLPEIEEGDAGKVLKVNEAEDGVEWGEAGGGAFDRTVKSIVIAGENKLGAPTTPFSSPDGKPQGSSIILDSTPKSYTTTNTNYVTMSTDSTCYFSDSLLIGKQTNSSASYRCLPNVSKSIYIGPWRDYSGKVYASTQCEYSIVSLPDSAIPGLDHGAGSSILLGPYCSIGNGQSSSICLTYSPTGRYANSGLLNMGMNLPGGIYAYYNCIFNAYDTTVTVSDYETYATGYTVLGRGHAVSISRSRPSGFMVVGKYSDTSDVKDQFIVGAGSSSSARANCFTTGNDGTENYIKVGNTKVTESQLQALLALLNQ